MQKWWEENMEEELKQQQIEALKLLYDYNKRLLDAVPKLAGELREGRRPDTEEYQNKIIEGLNWEISVLNVTLPLINENEEQLSKEQLNLHIRTLETALASGEDEQIANAMENEILPVAEQIDEVVSEVLLKVL